MVGRCGTHMWSACLPAHPRSTPRCWVCSGNLSHNGGDSSPPEIHSTQVEARETFNGSPDSGSGRARPRLPRERLPARILGCAEVVECLETTLVISSSKQCPPSTPKPRQ